MLKRKNFSSLFFYFLSIAIAFFIAFTLLFNKSFSSNKKITLEVATNTPYVPFEMIEDGKLIGIDIDIGEEISKRTGLNFHWNDIPFDTIIAGLTEKKIDLAIAGLEFSEERAKKVDFTSSYYKDNFTLIVKSTSKYQTLKQLSGKKIATQHGTTTHDYLLKYNKVNPEQQIEIFAIDDNSLAIEMLLTDKVDALLFSEMQGKIYTQMYKGLTYTRIEDNEEGGVVIALQKNSPYTKIINDTLIQMKKEGLIDKIVKKWVNYYASQTIKEQKAKNYKKSLLYIVKGSLITIQYALCSIVCGLILALFLTLLMYSGKKSLHFFTKAYVSVIRGTPLLLQMSFVYFGLSHLLGLNIPIFASCIIAFSFNSAGYVVEIIRSGVRSIDKGQFDACKSLNLSKYQAIKDIYIPQVIHNIFPALINEFISLIKETSMVSVFGGYEIIKRTNLVISEYYSYFTPLIVAGITYYIMTFTLELLSNWWEKRYKY